MRPPSPFSVFRSAAAGAVMAVVLFEVLSRVLHVRPEVAAVVLGVTMFPALVTGLARQVGALVRDPDRWLATTLLAFGNIAIAIFFFAYLYLERGIYAVNDPLQREVTDFFTCLYFSASTLTNAGIGDFVPRPETRFIAALEMMFGYIALGILTSASFFLLVHHSRKPLSAKAEPARS